MRGSIWPTLIYVGGGLKRYLIPRGSPCCTSSIVTKWINGNGPCGREEANTRLCHLSYFAPPKAAPVVTRPKMPPSELRPVPVHRLWVRSGADIQRNNLFRQQGSLERANSPCVRLTTWAEEGAVSIIAISFSCGQFLHKNIETCWFVMEAYSFLGLKALGKNVRFLGDFNR